MIRYLVCFCFVVFASIVQASQPDRSSIMLVEQENGKWLLQIRSTLASFEYEIKEHYGEIPYTSAEEFQALLVEYLQKQIAVRFNGAAPVSLKQGLVKLGHETNVVFQVIGTPTSLQSVEVVNNSFKDIDGHQSTLTVLKKGFLKNQFVLNKANNHRAVLKTQATSFVLVSTESTEKNDQSILFSIGMGVLLLLGGLTYLMRLVLFRIAGGKRIKTIAPKLI